MDSIRKILPYIIIAIIFLIGGYFIGKSAIQGQTASIYKGATSITTAEPKASSPAITTFKSDSVSGSLFITEEEFSKINSSIIKDLTKNRTVCNEKGCGVSQDDAKAIINQLNKNITKLNPSNQVALQSFLNQGGGLETIFPNSDVNSIFQVCWGWVRSGGPGNGMSAFWIGFGSECDGILSSL